MDSILRRRAFLAIGGGIGASSVAGCTDRLATESTATGDDNSAGDTERDDTETGPAAVVSQHHLATEAGLEVLQAGGTAADAAIAVASALSVVEPWFSSALGGGTWALYYDAETGDVTSVDGVGPVGSEASVEDFAARAGEPGIHQAVVPGAWDGWMLGLEAFGTLDLDEVLSPAVTRAREGYPASAAMERWLDREAEELADRPDALEIYARGGEDDDTDAYGTDADDGDLDLVDEGDTVYQEAMADTFEALAAAYDDRRDEGRSEAIQASRDYFYRGPIAEEIVRVSEERDGYLTLEDFRGFEADLVEPISIEYDADRALRVYQNPPNSQGITQLLALNAMKGFDLSGLDPDGPDAVHRQVEAIALAFADRYAHVGDPERVEVPVAELLDDDYAASQRDRIDDEAMTWPIDSGLSSSPSVIDISSSSVAGVDDSAPFPPDANTTTFHVVDAEGNAAAVTTSLGAQFLVIGDTGIHINNRMRMVALDEDDPNRLTPGYKVRHTSNPFLATRDGRPYILGGTTGVDTQPQGQVQQFVNVADFGFDAQEALDRPRFVSSAFPSTQYPYEADNELQIESGYPDETIDELEDRGHDVQVDAGSYGTANMLVIDEDEEGRSIQIGAEPRIESADGDVLENS